MTADIHCAGGCGKVIASTEIEKEEDFKGDAFYGMYCDECTRPKEEVTPA